MIEGALGEAGWLTAGEMAALLGITICGVWRRGRRGTLERRRVGHGNWRYRVPDAERGKDGSAVV